MWLRPGSRVHPQLPAANLGITCRVHRGLPPGGRMARFSSQVVPAHRHLLPATHGPLRLSHNQTVCFPLSLLPWYGPARTHPEGPPHLRQPPPHYPCPPWLLVPLQHQQGFPTWGAVKEEPIPHRQLRYGSEAALSGQTDRLCSGPATQLPCFSQWGRSP